MQSPIEAIKGNLTAIPVTKEEQTKSGLYIPQTALEEMEVKTAKVVHVGSEVTHIKVGDEIIYKPYATFDFKYEKTDYVMLAEEDVLGVIRRGSNQGN